jgi:hypothetical protein
MAFNNKRVLRLSAACSGRVLLALAAMIVAWSGHAASFPPLSVARDAPLVLVRDDDRVYVFGGWDSQSRRQFDTLQIYDPKDGSILASRGPEASARGGYATLLSENRILVCRPQCYVYVPRLDAWQTTDIPGSITPLVPLKDGRVLMAGGLVSLYAIPASYLIDPQMLTAALTGSLNVPRASDMVRVRDGRVLAVGGYIAPMLPGQDSTELYDPAVGRWKLVAHFQGLTGTTALVPLNDGTALAVNWETAAIYDPLADRWNKLAGLAAPMDSRAILLPDGQVLIAGGQDRNGKILSDTAVFDPVTRTVRVGRPMQIPRARHGLVVLHDGTALAIGGATTGGVPTASVERITWEPRIAATIDKGFYIATSTARTTDDGGFWGIEANTAGRIDGPLYFGGSLPGGGKDVGFGGFYLPEAQTVRGSVDFQPIGSATFEVTIRLLDVNKQAVAPAITGGMHIDFGQALSPGFYVIELQTSDRSPPATYQFALNAAHLAGGAVAGGVLDPATSSAPGYAAFYLTERQDVTIGLYNENTYGTPRGAAEVILTLYDSTGKVIARSGPGASPP